MDNGVAVLHSQAGAVDFTANIFNQLGNFFNCVGASGSQLAHFTGNDGKALAHFSCPGRLDCGVEREEVGLFRNLCYQFQHIFNALGGVNKVVNQLVDLLRGRADLRHGVCDFNNSMTAGSSLMHGGSAIAGGFACKPGDHLGAVSHLLSRVLGLVNGGGVKLHVAADFCSQITGLLQAAGTFFDGGGYLLAGGDDDVSQAFQLLDNVGQTVGHEVGVTGSLTNLVPGDNVHSLCKVAGGNILHDGNHLAQRPGNRFGDKVDNSRNQCHC